MKGFYIDELLAPYLQILFFLHYSQISVPGVIGHIYIVIQLLSLHLSVIVVESAKWPEVDFLQSFIFYGIASSKLTLLRNTIKQHKLLPLNPMNAQFDLLLVKSHRIPLRFYPS